MEEFCSEAITERFPACVELLRRAVSTEVQRCYLQARKCKQLFRLTGVLEIVIGVSLPVLYILPDPPRWWFYLLAGISLLVAIMAALRTFFGWDTNWQLFQTQYRHLRRVLRAWELDMLAILGSDEIEVAKDSTALKVTTSTVHSIEEALEYEQESFFNAVKIPDLSAREPAFQSAAS